MFIKTVTEAVSYTRASKLGKEHSYTRQRTIAILRCDNCDEMFQRDLKHMDRKRLSNNYFHVCSNCDGKKFAQRKRIERRTIWDMPASVDLPVSKY